MKALLLFALMFSTLVFAQDGKILDVKGTGDAYLIRGGSKVLLAKDAPLEEGDQLFSQDSVILLHLYPSTQMVLGKNSEIKITKNLIEEKGDREKSESVIGLIKGLIRIKLIKGENEDAQQTVEGKDVAFSVRGTDYEISMMGDEYDLDVHEGSVEASSPLVMTFVPQIVDAGKGLKFNRGKRIYSTRKLISRFKQAPGFLKKEELRERWAKARQLRKDWKLQREGLKEKRVQSFKEKKEIRREKRKKRTQK